MAAICELDDKGKRIRVWWEHVDRATFARYVDAVKSVAGRRFQAAKGDLAAHWTVPATMDSCRLLRAAYGSELTIGPRLREWAREQVASERNLGSLAATDTGTLERLPSRLPALAAALHLGPAGKRMDADQRAAGLAGPGSYQVADTLFMAQAPAPLNANHMGLGKTLETIGSVFESGMEHGAHLVVTPVAAVETVWGSELALWQDLPVLVATGKREERLAQVRIAQTMHANGESFWLVVNPDMVTYVKDETNQATDWLKTKLTKAQTDKLRHGARASAVVWALSGLQVPANNPHGCTCAKKKGEPHYHYAFAYEGIQSIKWQHVIIDEAHKAAIGNTKSIKSHAFAKLQATKRMMLTGTPMGGKPLKLFGLLQFLRPDVFTSKWTWADRWLEIDEGDGYGKKITNDLKDGVEDAFNQHLIPFVLRRTKEEVLKWLPPKDIIDLWVEMTPGQAEQYAQFAADAYLEMEDGELYGKAVLDQYTRLRQFATARQTLERGSTKLIPTTDSGKLEQVELILEELGITGEDPSDEQVVIFSQWTEVVEMVEAWLRDKGVTTSTITGKVAHSKRTAAQRDFQAGKVQAMVLNVMAGGVAINLDNANTAIFMDETWNPDDCEQAEDRIHRASRIHQVTCYYLRSKGTIEEELFDVVTGKSMTNAQVLDWRKKQKVEA